MYFKERALPCSAQLGCTAPTVQADTEASGVSEATPTLTPKTLVAEPGDDVRQAAMEDSLSPKKRSLPYIEQTLFSSTQPNRTVPADAEDAAKYLNGMPVTRNIGMNPVDDKEDDPSHEKQMISHGEYKRKLHCFTTPQVKAQAGTIRPRTNRCNDGGRNVSVARPKDHRAARSGRTVKRLQEYAISISVVKSSRLIWDPGVNRTKPLDSPFIDDDHHQMEASIKTVLTHLDAMNLEPPAINEDQHRPSVLKLKHSLQPGGRMFSPC